MRRRVLLGLVLLCVCTSDGNLVGQEPGPDPVIDARGFQQNRDYFSPLPFEHIDTTTGSLVLSFTDLVLPGNAGFNLTFARTYNSKGGGWTFGLQEFPLVVGPYRPEPATDPDDQDHWTLPQFYTADGSDPYALWKDAVGLDETLITSRFWLYHHPSRTLRLPNGLEGTFTPNGPFTATLTEVHDPFGNSVTFTWGSSGLESVTQHLGNGQSRQVTFAYAGAGFPHTMTYDERTWTYDHNSQAPWQMTSATPPLGPSWQFGYNGASALLATVTTPHGGQVHYTFQTHYFERDQPRLPGLPNLVPSTVLASRTTAHATIAGGTWNFSFDPEHDDRLTITGPEDRTILHESQWGPGGNFLPLRRTVQPGGAPFEVEALTYGVVLLGPGFGAEYLLDVVNSRTVQRSGRTYTTTYEYRSTDYRDYGHPSRLTEVGDATRVTDVEYKHDISAYVRAKVQRIVTTVNGESIERSYSYSGSTGFRESQTIHGTPLSFFPDPFGNVERVRDAHGPSHDVTHSYEWGVRKNTTTPEYAITREINSNGTVFRETRRGFTTEFQYDALGRQVIVKPPTGHWFRTEYDNATAAWVRQLRGGTPQSETIVSLDGFGRTIATANSVGVKTTHRYDAYGRKVFESAPFEGTAEVGTTFRYDRADRLTETETTDGHRISYTYTNGVDTTITEQNGSETRVTVQNWDAFGDPDDVRLVGVIDAEGGPWGYQYNALGLLTRVMQPDAPDRTWNYYPGTDRLQAETHPENGQTTFEYDSAGRLSFKDTPRGRFTYGYDANDRVTQIAAPVAVHSVTMDYDESDNRILLSNGFVSSTFRFDAANRLEWRKDTIAGDQERQTTYQYDMWDNLAALTYPSARTVTYEYDSEKRVIAAFREPGHVRMAQVEAYHPSGAPRRLRLGNDIVEDYGFHPQRYWLTSIGGGPTAYTYQYYPVGNVQSVTDHTNSALNQQFGYDRLDRLTAVTGLGANAFQYDAVGNRRWKQAGNVTYGYDGANRLDWASGPQPNPEVGDYHFDGAGAMIVDPSGTYSYTPFDMMETATVGGVTTVYRYDGDGIRKKRSGPQGDRYFFHGAGPQLLSEWASTAGGVQWQRDYVYLGDRLVSSISPGQSVTVQFTQAQTVVSEASGSVGVTVQIVTEDGAPLRQPATVAYATANGTAVNGADFTHVSSVLTFAAGTPSSATQSITVPILQDTESEPWGENFRIDLSSPGNATLGSTTAHTLIIADDEALLEIEQPANNAAIAGPFTISGWAINPSVPTGTGVDMVHIHAYPNPGSGQPSIFLGAATYGGSRSDVAAMFGSRFTNSGYHLNNVRLKPGITYLIAVYARNSQSGLFDTVRTRMVASVGLSVDTPIPEEHVNWNFLVAGWAADCSAQSGPGVGSVKIRAFREGQAAPVTDVISHYFFDRGDLAVLCGESFRYSGFAEMLSLQPGRHRIEVSSYEPGGAFLEMTNRFVTVVASEQRMSIDIPLQNATTTQPFVVGGWAIDLHSPSGTGVDAVHVHAYPNPGSGQPAIFLGEAIYGVARQDVADLYGAAKLHSGYNFVVSGLAPGTYLIAVFPRSTVTGAFGLASTVTVTVQ